MTAKKPAADKTAKARPDVTLYPTGDAWIPDVEPVEQTVSAERADELLAYSPAAFTTKPPKKTKTPAAETTEAPQVVAPPSTETTPADGAGTSTQEA